MTQLGWLEWRLTDEELPDLFGMVDAAFPEMASVVDLTDAVDASVDPHEFARDLAQDIAQTLTGQFAAVGTSPPPVDPATAIREIPRPRDSRPLLDDTGESIRDGGEFAAVPNTSTAVRAMRKDTPSGFQIDHDILAMFDRGAADEDVTIEVDLSDLTRVSRFKK